MPRSSLAPRIAPALLLVAAACLPHNSRRTRPVGPGMGGEPSLPDPRGPAGRLIDTLTSGAARKEVAGKEEPATLIAVDRTRCTVTPDRFRDVRTGEFVWCVWRRS
jgi:hypothetical protein